MLQSRPESLEPARRARELTSFSIYLQVIRARLQSTQQVRSRPSLFAGSFAASLPNLRLAQSALCLHSPAAQLGPRRSCTWSSILAPVPSRRRRSQSQSEPSGNPGEQNKGGTPARQMGGQEANSRQIKRTNRSAGTKTKSRRAFAHELGVHLLAGRQQTAGHAPSNRRPLTANRSISFACGQLAQGGPNWALGREGVARGQARASPPLELPPPVDICVHVKVTLGPHKLIARTPSRRPTGRGTRVDLSGPSGGLRGARVAQGARARAQ